MKRDEEIERQIGEKERRKEKDKRGREREKKKERNDHQSSSDIIDGNCVHEVLPSYNQKRLSMVAYTRQGFGKGRP